MTVKDFVVQKLTTFNIAANGTRCRMNFISGDGDQACLSLPTDCLTELIMTLPRMARQALRARRHRGSQGPNCARNDPVRPSSGRPRQPCGWESHRGSTQEAVRKKSERRTTPLRVPRGEKVELGPEVTCEACLSR